MKKISALIVSVLLMCSSAYAAVLDVKYDDVEEYITISGELEDYTYSDTFSLAVFKAGKGYETMESYETEDFNDAMVFFASYMTEDDGTYNLVLDTKEMDMGDYTVVITLDDDTTEKYSLMLAPRKTKTDLIAELIKMVEEGTDAGKVNAKLALTDAESFNARLFGMSKESIIFEVGTTGLSKVLIKTIEDGIKDAEKEGKEFTLTPEEFIPALEYCAKIQLVNEGKLNPAKDEETISFFELDEDYLSDYNTKVSKENKEKFTEFFKDGSLLTTKSVSEAFNKAVITNLLYQAKSWKNYKDIIEAYGEDIDIDMDDYEDLKKKDKVSDYLANKYTDLSKFVDDVNEGIKEASGGRTGGSSGGSSGGISGMSGMSNKEYPMDVEAVTKEEPKSSFTDLEGYDWAKEAILNLADKGIVAGIGDGSFLPGDNVTREQFVKMLVVAMNIPVEKGSTAFGDVTPESWYADYVYTASRNGIVSGTSETTFGVGADITREQAAAMLYRAASLSKANGAASFTDNADIADYAKEAVDALSGLGVINGVDGAFKPKATASRAEAAVMIYRLLSVLNK